ncbi:DUF3185 family protein [Alteromonas aestuariivivens]|uniref:DUF3185 family protein n=1 Tax=Alteromonas aestuariivivens TaxID=1938339 RepID=A0A3D8MAZ2_9ALTE|nr:DUF3185 family protein [Alteromonas aestuariivivens]RDV27544.1 DUF3185 family protein [Alteromonas aestuariivivens]
MSTSKIIAIALFIVGAGLLYYGYQISGSVSSQLQESVTGSMSDKAIWHYAGGIICLVVGAILIKK